MRPIWVSLGRLTASSVDTTFARCARLENPRGKPRLIEALFPWGIAQIENLLQVPVKGSGSTELRIEERKIVLEVITLALSVPFAIFHIKQPVLPLLPRRRSLPRGRGLPVCRARELPWLRNPRTVP